MFASLKLLYICVRKFTMANNNLRVLQLIDSLEAGGSEKMAVQIANLLSEKIEISALISTHHSGSLTSEISDKVFYASLNKKHKFDLKAFKKLRKFVNQHKIEIIHAHSTSFFWATFLKLFRPKLKLIWHDHYGHRYKTDSKQNFPLYLCSFLFTHIITVNDALKLWATQNLKCKNIDFIQNFSEFNTSEKHSKTKLKGNKNDFKIIHVANLRPEKDHLTALKSIRKLLKDDVEVSYHLIGKYDKNNDYYKKVLDYIKTHNLTKNVFIYGHQSDIYGLLKQANLGILTSISEGLPLSLLEYAMAEIPIIATNVGECKNIIKDNGIVIQPKNYEDLADAIDSIIYHKAKFTLKSKQLKNEVLEKYNSNTIINDIIEIYNLSLHSK